jgi:hypothetical protein
MDEMIRQMRQRITDAANPLMAFTNAFNDICDVYKEGGKLY